MFMLIQWSVKLTDGRSMPLFTLHDCSEDEAKSIAAATFGDFRWIENEGEFWQKVPR